jgi:serine protease Do
MVKFLVALLMVIFQVSQTYGQPQKQPARKPILKAEQIAAAILPSLVLITVECDDGRNLSQGSGFFISRDMIATNRHVIRCGNKGVIKFQDRGPQYPIASIWTEDDSPHDLAILKIEGATGKPLPLGNGQNLTIGKTVYVAGNPRGLEGTFSNGIISSIRKSEGLIQFTAPISPGSSGGPVVNESGEVIGVATANINGQNLNFAVEISNLTALIDQMRRGVLKPRTSQLGPRKAEAVASKKPHPPVAPRASAKRVWKTERGMRIVVLIDGSSSANALFGHILETGRQFINTLKPNDEASIVVFAGAEPFQAQDFTSDKRRLMTAFEGLKPSGGTTTLIDALYIVSERAADYASDNGGRPMIVAITDGVESHSAQSRSALYRILGQEDVPVYSIGLVNWLGKKPPDGIFRESQRDIATKFLTDVAQRSGGQAFFPNLLGDLPETICEIASRIYQDQEGDAESKLWKAAKLSGKPQDFEAYLTKYPQGIFSNSARAYTSEGKITHRELDAIASQYVNAILKGDAAALHRLLADKYVAIAEGKAVTKPQAMANIQPDQRVKTFQIERTELNFRDGDPILTFSVKYAGLPHPLGSVLPTLGDGAATAKYLNSMRFENLRGQWKIVELRWSRIDD